MTISVAKKAENAFTVGNNRACSDERYGKDKYGDGKTPTARGRVSSKELIWI